MIYKIVEVHRDDGFYGQGWLVGEAGTIEDMFDAPGYPGWKGGFFELEECKMKYFFRAIKVEPVLRGLYKTKKEREMEVTVRGVELKGDKVYVEGLLKSLGISLKTYHSRSTGKNLLIRDMDTNHIKNAVIKMLRESDVFVGETNNWWQAVDLWDVLRAFVGMLPEERFLEMDAREFIEFFNLFVDGINKQECFDLLEELKGRDF